ncbi:MAG: hypothetical protein QME51_07135, partial [Planctomycetota bacterium]|nr:hypothetical protein [Planctomycetota bacterium]
FRGASSGTDNLKRTIFFAKSDSIDLLKPVGGDFKDTLFKMKKGEYRLIEDESVYYVVQVLEKRVPEPARFDSERKDLQKSLRDSRRKEFIKTWLERIKKEVQWKNYLEKKTASKE